jgi:hypothetical protein
MDFLATAAVRFIQAANLNLAARSSVAILLHHVLHSCAAL